MPGIFKNINNQSSDEELMAAVAKGNRKAFEMLYDRYFGKLVNFCKRLIFDDHLVAEDIVQEFFVKIIHQPHSFDTKRTFTTWAYTAVKNKCLNHLRDEQNRRELLERNYPADTSYIAHSSTDANNLKRRIGTIFNTLSDKEKTIFVLRFEQELSIQKIAEIAEIPEGSVKSGIYYLLKKISIQLKDYMHEY